MPDKADRGSSPQGGGVNERTLDPATDEPLGGTGGAAGGGTRAGAGDPSGERTDRPSPDAGRGDISSDPRSTSRAGKGGGLSDSEEADEAAALGPADASLAEGRGQRTAGAPTIGEAVGGGPGRQTGSGTRTDKSGLGGGGAAGQHGGTGPEGAASPGGDNRR